jgi:hypothetical protein
MLVGVSSHLDVKVSVEVIEFRKFGIGALKPQRNKPHIVNGALFILLDAVLSVPTIAATYSILLGTCTL